MRVAIVTESFLPSLNGVTNSVVKVLETLRERGHEVLVIAPTRVGHSYRGVPVITTPRVMVAKFPLGIPAPAVSSALDEFSPDLIHAASPFMLGGHALAYAARAGIASVAVYQTDISGYMQRYGLEFATPLLDSFVAAIHKPATLNLAPTASGVAYLKSLGLSQVASWGRGVDSELFTPHSPALDRQAQLRARLAPGGERIIGYVGRLAPEKQVGRLKELVDIPNSRIVIVGDGPEREELEQAFSHHCVTFLGKLAGLELAEAYRAMDIFVHCGEEETFGQTIQEAQASGTPVVAADRGGPRHLINHGETGFLVDPSRWGGIP